MLALELSATYWQAVAEFVLDNNVQLCTFGLLIYTENLYNQSQNLHSLLIRPFPFNQYLVRLSSAVLPWSLCDELLRCYI